MKKESKFQHDLIKEIQKRFQGAIVLKNDSNYIQGFPDLLILFGKFWAALECKRTSNSARQPNQEYYIDTLGRMSYASFVCPENKEEVLNGLQRAFEDEE